MTAKKKFIILVASIRQATGGFASILEMAQSLSAMDNVQVDLFALRIDIKFARRVRILKEDKKNRNIHFHYYPSFGNRVRSSSPRERKHRSQVFLPQKGTSIRAIKRLIELLLSPFFRQIRRKFDSLMCSSDVVIKSLVLTGYEMEFLRRRTKSTIIQNHAGSPETYEKYWLKDEQLSQDMNVNLPPYVRFCLMFDKILFQSKLQAQECESKHKKLAGKSLVLLPTCNESEAENAARSHSPFPSDQIALINVGVLSPRKAQLETIQAFEKIASNFPNLRLYFLGSTTMWKQYYKEIFFHVKEFGLDDKIRFLGHRGDYLRYMAHADCIIQTSRAEGVSRVLRESMFLKLPIVSYAISGTVDLVKNGSEALLVDPGDVEGLSKALTTLLTDESRREDLAERAHDKYLLRHANQVYRSNLVKLFSSVQRRSGG